MQVALGGGASECVSLCVRAVCVCVCLGEKEKKSGKKKCFYFFIESIRYIFTFCQKEVGLTEA